MPKNAEILNLNNMNGYEKDLNLHKNAQYEQNKIAQVQCLPAGGWMAPSKLPFQLLFGI